MMRVAASESQGRSSAGRQIDDDCFVRADVSSGHEWITTVAVMTD
jgi:hypothetical protein